MERSAELLRENTQAAFWSSGAAAACHGTPVGLEETRRH